MTGAPSAGAAAGGRAWACKVLALFEGALVIDRHDLDEFGDINFPVFEQRAGAFGVCIMGVIFDELAQAFGVEAGHVGHHIDEAMHFEIAALVSGFFHHEALGFDRLELDHGHIAVFAKLAVLVEHIGDAARHACGEVASGRTEHNDNAAGHIFAAMVSAALDDGDGAGIAHGEALPGDAAEVA